MLSDQATKFVARTWLVPQESVRLWPGVFHITLVRNTGAAFGLMPGARPLFIGTSVLVLVGIAAYWWWSRPRAAWVAVALALAAGGASGNLIDRTLAGRVTDFLDIALIDFPIFNLADIAIVSGVMMLVVWILIGPEGSEDSLGQSEQGDEDPGDAVVIEGDA